MATLVRDVERPAFLDRTADEQLSFGGSTAPVAPRPGRRERGGDADAPDGSATVPLSARLRAERASAARVTGSSGTTRGGGATLDELLVGAWEGLSAHRPVTCPVCSGPMEPRRAAAGGACGGCGSQLR